MITHYDKILPSQEDLYKFDRATNPKWKYGVIDPPPQATQVVIQQPKLQNVQSAGGNGSGGFGLFELTKNVQGGPGSSVNGNVLQSDAMKNFSQSTGSMNAPNKDRSASTYSKYGASGKQMVGNASEINKVQLKSTSINKGGSKSIAPSASQSGTVDFRAVLKKTNSNKIPALSAKDDSAHQYNHSGVMDWKAQMKSRKKPAASVPPKELDQQLASLQNPNSNSIGGNGQSQDDILPSPKLPPPNPIEVMSTEQRQRQKENTQILEVFQDFEDNMAQYDEEIDFKQDFSESIVSQIMELAENNKVISAPKYVKQIDAKCKLVIDAAKRHSEALQQFNQMLQNIYSQIEDEMESGGAGGNDNQGGIMGVNGSSSNLTGHVTAGGPDDGAPSGLPKSNTNYSNYSMDLDQDDWKGGGGGHQSQASGGLAIAGNHSAHNSQQSYDQKTIAAAISGGLPRYQSATDIQKQGQEQEKKVAKALFDYPGGYRSNELTFHRGTSLIITKEKEGWVYGYYELEPSLTGWFPKSYVKIISG
eukprot:CAMPEP_0201592848 /NCGR_PEP_ID=MMETSP0190_2-20130828/190622_1 /ASSEMBLY_ACC=CAM_ASM_000263 /TAXON_ID=37353 /ORGANISM="Rosalina sp." /LENGTH=531 /DNA_ID=CAMNT_0048051791 /DNA_START=1394 /DNA_END=2989 /DNA_ORIENTATION=-